MARSRSRDVVAVTRADIDVNRRIASEPFDGPLLKCAQELGLERSSQLADLVRTTFLCSASSNRPIRRNRALVKAPFSCPKSSDSSRASGMEAQFTLTSGPLVASAVMVDGVHHQFLACAGLSAHEHRGVGRRHLPDQLVDVLHRRAVPDHGLRDAPAAVPVPGAARSSRASLRAARRRAPLASAEP